MIRNLKTTLIANLAICLVCAIFISSCNREEKRRQREEEQRQKEEALWLQEQMDKITPEVFEPYLKEHAEEIIIENFGNNGILGWKIDYSYTLGDITLQEKEDKKGKIGKGTFRVKMISEWKAWKIPKEGGVDVTVSGALNINSDGSLSFVPESAYSFENRWSSRGRSDFLTE